MTRVTNYEDNRLVVRLSEEDIDLIKYHYEVQSLNQEILDKFISDSIDFLFKIKSGDIG
jgi:hypothetical protein